MPESALYVCAWGELARSARFDNLALAAFLHVTPPASLGFPSIEPRVRDMKPERMVPAMIHLACWKTWAFLEISIYSIFSIN